MVFRQEGTKKMNRIIEADPGCRHREDRLKALLEIARKYGTMEEDPSWTSTHRIRIEHYRWLYEELTDMGMYPEESIRENQFPKICIRYDLDREKPDDGKNMGGMK